MLIALAEPEHKAPNPLFNRQMLNETCSWPETANQLGMHLTENIRGDVYFHIASAAVP